MHRALAWWYFIEMPAILVGYRLVDHKDELRVITEMEGK